MATSFIQMAYSLINAAWVGRIGSEAVAAIGTVGILAWMATSISLLNKVGSEVSVGQAIGAKDENKAKTFASHNLTIALIISILLGTLLFIFANPIIGVYELNSSISAKSVLISELPGFKITSLIPFTA
jgi:Na+-driven multidrug efflux pump